MSAPKLTVGRKFALLLAAFLALQMLQLGMGLYQVRHVAEEAEHLSGAGKIRPGLLADLARRALAPGGEPAARQKFLDMLAAHDRIHRQLVADYGSKTGDPEYGELARLIVEAGDAWERELRPPLLALDAAQPAAARAALARYEALAPAHAGRIARLVALLEQELDREVREALRIHGFIFVLSMLLAAAAVILVRRRITLPLRALAEASRAMAEGSYDRRLAVASRDEIGALAGTFNRMAEVVGERTARIMALNRVAAAVTSSLTTKEILDQIMYHGIGVSGAKAACLAFYDEQTGRFTNWVTQGLSDHFVKNMAFRPGGLADETFTTGSHVLSNDRPETKHKLSKLTHAEGIRSFLCLPLTSQASRLGVIYFYRADSDTFSAEEISLLSTFAHLAAQAIENARLHARTLERARTDALTALYNRREFELRLAEEHRRAARYGKPYAFMMLDIDRFKQVNDTYGHAAGDAALKSLAGILKKQFRDVDTVARYGGEEFAVILPEISGGTAKPVAERVRRAVAATPFRLPDGREIGLTVSIGVSCYPNCADTPQEVVNRADQALYTAKEAGRNRVVLYHEMLKKRIDEDPSCIVALLNESLDNIRPIVTAVSAKGAFFRKHMDMVEQAALQLARALRLTAADTEALKLASRLHDIGMAAIPDAVLNKTEQLTPEEWEQVRRHSAIGADWLEQVPALKHLAPLVRHHHERYDGSGYPDGLKGEATPYLARVLAAADAYGSMITDWPGHKGMSASEAIAALRTGAGTQFDPLIAEALMRISPGETQEPAQK